ncbi:MAG: OB-fold domain-containing protein [Actinomycetota bacterium]
MSGILGYATYLPYYRLKRGAIAAMLGGPPAKGTRAVASYDEDSTSMAVAATRRLLAHLPGDLAALYFTTTTPAYLDKTNATAVHAALGLPAQVGAYDMGGAVRSAVGLLVSTLASTRPALVVAADIRTGLPGSEDERDGGDGAAAFLVGPGSEAHPVLAECVATGSATGEFLERWRVPGEAFSRRWEDRFGVHAFLPHVGRAVATALAGAGIAPDAVDHLIVTGTHPRAAAAFARLSRAKPEVLVNDLTATVGNTGAAHPGVLLASALDAARPGAVIALVVLADGADVAVFRATPALAEHRSAPSVAEQTAAGREVAYPDFLTWRGMLTRQGPRRPDPAHPAAPPALRSEAWKFGFTATRCRNCGTRHLPPQRVCAGCGTTDQMAPERLADVPGTIATFTVDRLAYSLSPPVVAAVVDFDGGGRYRCELTDVDPAAVAIGSRVEMTFRRLFTAGGVHNYFWKARLIEDGAAAPAAAGPQGA